METMEIKKKTVKNDGDKPNWTLLEEYKSPKIDALFKVYDEDKAKAKIYFHLNRGSFVTTRKVLFEYPNGDFKFVRINKTYGISSTNKMYSHEKTLDSIMYRNGKFYSYDNQGKKAFIQSLSYHGIFAFTNRYGHHETITNYFTKRFGWVRYISEDSATWTIIFDTVVKKKLFNKKAMYRYIYGCPYPIASFVHEYAANARNPIKYLKVWKEMRKTLYNIENLKSELFTHQIFQDTCRMAQMVGEKVNCSWGIKRLTSEHDKWSKIVTQVLLENEPLMDLSIHPIFEEFAAHSGYHLLTTNHELIAEGSQMNHCVGTYSSVVNNGYSGIYRAHDHTLELKRNGDKLSISQYMGYSNVSAAASLREKVESALKTFKASEEYSGFYYKVNDEDDLPF
jgi:hypothetical protein